MFNSCVLHNLKSDPKVSLVFAVWSYLRYLVRQKVRQRGYFAPHLESLSTPSLEQRPAGSGKHNQLPPHVFLEQWLAGSGKYNLQPQHAFLEKAISGEIDMEADSQSYRERRRVGLGRHSRQLRPSSQLLRRHGTQALFEPSVV